MSELLGLGGVAGLTEGHESLADVNLSVTEGACTVIMGSSGSGKSTLLKVAAGLIPPDRGTVTLLGDDFGSLGERRLLEFRRGNGVVFQDGALWENLSIFDNLAMPLRVHFAELGEAEIRARVLEMLGRGGPADSPALRPAP